MHVFLYDIFAVVLYGLVGTGVAFGTKHLGRHVVQVWYKYITAKLSVFCDLLQQLEVDGSFVLMPLCIAIHVRCAYYAALHRRPPKALQPVRPSVCLCPMPMILLAVETSDFVETWPWARVMGERQYSGRPVGPTIAPCKRPLRDSYDKLLWPIE